MRNTRRLKVKLTSNDVIDFARFYNGKDEPPRFYREAIDFSNKVLFLKMMSRWPRSSI